MRVIYDGEIVNAVINGEECGVLYADGDYVTFGNKLLKCDGSVICTTANKNNRHGKHTFIQVGDDTIELVANDYYTKIITAYIEWYRKYCTSITRGTIELKNKPPMTLNMLVWICHCEIELYIGADFSIKKLKADNYAYVDSEDSCVLRFMPYIKLYKYADGEIVPLEWYNPDEETCEMQYVSYYIVTETMKRDMFHTQQYRDITFEFY